jgi:hypothetical protein
VPSLSRESTIVTGILAFNKQGLFVSALLERFLDTIAIYWTKVQKLHLPPTCELSSSKTS